MQWRRVTETEFVIIVLGAFEAPDDDSCLVAHPRSRQSKCFSNRFHHRLTRMVVAIKTLGELEAATCAGVSRFEQDYMGRGPKNIQAHLLGDLLVVRLQGVLTAAEQQLVKSLPAEKGRDLLKQVRTHLIETARPVLEAMVQEVTGIEVLSLHHDISTVTGEEIIVFALATSPHFREIRKR
jgi:uncharacterized protein YbcI